MKIFKIILFFLTTFTFSCDNKGTYLINEGYVCSLNSTIIWQGDPPKETTMIDKRLAPYFTSFISDARFYLGKDCIEDKLSTLKTITFDYNINKEFLGVTDFINGKPTSIRINPIILKKGRREVRELLYHELYHAMFPNYGHCHEMCNAIMSAESPIIAKPSDVWQERVKEMFLRLEH